MIIEERKNNELNLEAIEKDIRLDEVRQGAEKIGWDYMGKTVRRNLLEKRQTMDSRTRLDVLNTIQFMKQKIPIDESASFMQKVKQFAEGLGEPCSLTASATGITMKCADVTIEFGITEDKVVACKIGYFGQPLFDAPEALRLLKANKFTDFRNAVAGILSILPKDISVNDKNACKEGFRALEQLLIRDAADSSFNAINTNKYGFFSPRTELRAGRLYYLAEPMLVRFAEKEGKSHADSSYLDLLPYLEISLVKHTKPCKLPAQSEWAVFNDTHVCVCVRFKNAVLFSHETIRKLACTAPKSPLIRHYVNFYRFMSGKPFTKKNVKLLTQFPGPKDVQHRYTVWQEELKHENDPMVLEMFINDLGELPKLVQRLRSEWKHASLWESILAMCEPRPGEEPQKEVMALDVKLQLRRREIFLKFATSIGDVAMQLIEADLGTYTVRTFTQLTGNSASEELDKMLTEKLNSTWSIPATLTFAGNALKFKLISISPSTALNSSSTQSDNKSSIDFDKLHQAWLNPNAPTSQSVVIQKREVEVVEKKAKKTKIVLERGPKVEYDLPIYKREDDSEALGGLMAMFGEVDPYFVRTSTIGKTRPQPRPKRVIPEPRAIETMKPDERTMEVEKAKHNLEAAVMMRQHQQEMQRMSTLESARMRYNQSIGAGLAVGLANHPAIGSGGPGGPMRQHSYPMGLDSSVGAPYDPNIPASIQFPEQPALTAKGKPRKTRAKKQPEDGAVPPAGRGKGRKGRGAAAVGAAGGRKSTGVAPPENPYGMEQMRPPLQRSFSDYPGQMTPQSMAHLQQMQQMQQYQQSQQYRMQQQQQQHMHQMQHHHQMQQHQMQQMQSPMHPPMQSPMHPPMQSPMHPPMQPPQSIHPNMSKVKPPPYGDDDSDEECDPPPPPKPIGAQRPSLPQQLGNPMVGYPGMPLQSPNHFPLTPSPLSAPPKPFSPEQQQLPFALRMDYQTRHLDQKPDVAILKKQMAMEKEKEKAREAAAREAAMNAQKAAQAANTFVPVCLPGPTATSAPVLSQVPARVVSPPAPILIPEQSVTAANSAEAPKPAPVTPTIKKKIGIDALGSKLAQQKQQMQMQQHDPPQQQPIVAPELVEPKLESKPQKVPMMESSGPPLLAPHQVDRARNLENVFCDDSDESPDGKPVMSALQKALAAPPIEPNAPGPSSSGPPPQMPVLTPIIKRDEEDHEKERLVVKIKIPKSVKSSSSGESPRTRIKEDRAVERKDDRKDRDREREREKERDADRDREREREERAQREKEKKEREKEKRRQRDRERAEQKKLEKERMEAAAGKEKEASSSKKRKLDRKDEKDRREPERKKGKSDFKPATTTAMTNFSLKNFRIPKKDTVEDEKKDAKDEGNNSSSAAGPSASESSSRKESSSTSAAQSSRKESTSLGAQSSQMPRKESFSGISNSFPANDHHREPPAKKKAMPPPAGPSVGIYQGTSGMGPPSGNRGGGGGRKQPMPPPPSSMMRGGPPPDFYGPRERMGSMRGQPPSSYHHGSSSSSGGSGSSKQVASYAQGLPPGMGPPATKSHGSNYPASQWVRPPTHRESHSYHGMPSLGPPQLQREPPAPPPQMIPMPRGSGGGGMPPDRDPPILREMPRTAPESREQRDPRDPRVRGGGGGGGGGGGTAAAPPADSDGPGPESPEESTLRIDDE